MRAAIQLPSKRTAGSVFDPIGSVSARSVRRRRLIAARLTVVAASALSLSACSSGDPAGPATSGAAPSGAGHGDVVVAGAAIGIRSIWGAGRARLATATPDGAVYATTTTGVYGVTVSGEAASFEQMPVGVRPAAMSLSPDRSTLAVGLAAPPSVHMYHTASGTLLAAHELPMEAPVRSLTFDGARLIVDTPIGPLVAPNRTEPPVAVLEVPASGQSALLTDGSIVTPVAGTAELAITTVDGTSERRTLRLADGATVLDVRTSPDRSLIAITTGVGENLFEREDTVVVFDAATLTPRATIAAGLALEPRQWTVTDDAVVIADGATMRVFAPDGTPVDVAPAVDSSIAILVTVPDGLMTVHSSGEVVVWAKDTWQATVLGSGVPFESVTVSADGGTVTFVDRYGAITVRRSADGTPIRADDRFASGTLTDIAVADDGRIGVASSLGEVTVLDGSLTEQRVFTVTDGPAYVDAVSFDPVTNTIAAGLAERLSESAFDDTVRAWDGAAGSERFRTGGEAEDVSGCSFFYSRVRFAPDGATVAITSHDFTVQIVDTATGAVIQTLAGVTTVLDLAYTPDGTRLIATYDDGMVRVWSTDGYTEVASYRGVQGGYYAIAAMPDAASMVAADITGAINLIDIDTGNVLLGFADATHRTFDIAVSADGALLAAPTADGGVSVWSTADGTRLATAGGHTGTVTGIAFSPTGDWLATSSTDGTVRTWSIDVG